MKVLDTQPAPLNQDGEALDTNLVSTLIKMMDIYVTGQVNPTYERHLLRERRQRSGESIESFLMDIRIMIKTCEIPADFQDEMLKDQMVHGVQDQALKERLLQEQNLTLTKCIAMCKAAEAASAHLKGMNDPSSAADAQVAHVQQRPGKHGDKRKNLECKFCGLRHPMVKSKCPAVGKKCSSCGQLNHFAKKCSAGKKKPAKHVRHVQEDDQLSSDSDSVGMIGLVNGKSKEFNAKLKVQGRTITFLLDTGASSSLLPESCVDVENLNLGPPKILKMWNGSSEMSVGTAKLTVVNPKKNSKHTVTFDVVKGKHKPVLGLTDVLKMNLVSVNLNNFERVLNVKPVAEVRNKATFLKKYPNAFADAVGTFEGDSRLSVNDSPPEVLPTRSLPVSLRPKVKKELDRLLKLGIISKIDEPTSWVSQFVVREKKHSDQVRLCIDPKPLNKALQREHYHLPTFEEVLPDLFDAKIFTKCDLRSGYWHVKL
ncbi:MAG: retroviral-like aspartic protease family protein, partial [candidate division WOR-3 bacterium]|nr:retroviral-like aspartic protease family protein [candidate division WOR-3 bacterium]